MRTNIFLPILSLTLAVSVSAEPLNYNVVSFSESARTTVENDTMKVTFAIEEQDKNRQRISNKVTTRLNALNARIANGKGFKASLDNRNTRPTYNDKGEITGWHEAAYVSVESKNFQALSKLIAASQKEAAVRNMHFSLSPEKHGRIVNELSKQALQNFKARAEFISRTLGFKGYRIVNIKIDDHFQSFNTPTLRSKAYMAAMEASPMEMNADNSGTQEVVQTVSGTIQM